jgi:carboxymethylenebutenolidase
MLLAFAALAACSRKIASDAPPAQAATSDAATVVSFPSGGLTLRGVLYRPPGAGPFPAVLYNHGSLPGMAYQDAFETIGHLFASRGFVFFAPYRRGQGLSASASPYVMDEIRAARMEGGAHAGVVTMLSELEGDQLSDQLAALAWLREQTFIIPSRVAAAGNSFGGIETVLGVERAPYCAAIDASGGAETWAHAPELRARMLEAVQHANAPVFFFQAANDFDLSPTRELSAAMQAAGKDFEVKIYPAYGSSAEEGHYFAWKGSAVWGDDVVGFLERRCPPR